MLRRIGFTVTLLVLSCLPTTLHSAQVTARSSLLMGGASTGVAASGIPTVTQTITTSDVITWGPVRDEAGTLYVGTRSGEIAAVSASGVKRATVPGADILGYTLGASGTVFSASSTGVVSAFSVPLGKVVWSVALNQPMAAGPILLSNGTVSVFTSAATLYSLYDLDGAIQRSVKFESIEGFAGYASVQADQTRQTFYIGGADGVLYAIGPDGALWKNSVLGDVFRAPSKYPVKIRATTPSGVGPIVVAVLPSGDAVISWVINQVVARISPGGQLLWVSQLPAVSPLSAPAARPDGSLLFTAQDGGLMLTSAQDPMVSHLSTAAQLDGQGHIYVGTQDGRILSIASRDGGHLWQVVLPFPGQVAGISIGSDNTYAAAVYNHLVLLSSAPLFSLPMVITPQPAGGNHLRWTWTWTGKTKPQSYIAVIYHYSGKNALVVHPVEK